MKNFIQSHCPGMDAGRSLFLPKTYYMRFACFIILSLFFMACNSGTSADSNEPEKSFNDSLLQQVIDGHDVAMPKMMKLERLQKEAQAALDSLTKAGAARHKDRISLLETTVKDLRAADIAMNEWMNGFRYDSLKDKPAERETYLKAQLESVNKMKDLVLKSITGADSVLKN